MSDCIPCGCRDSLPTKELGIEEWKDEYLKLVIYASAVSMENKKLRELVSWMYDRMDESCAVQHPYAPAPISYDRLMQAQARARELGVRVVE